MPKKKNPEQFGFIRQNAYGGIEFDLQIPTGQNGSSPPIQPDQGQGAREAAENTREERLNGRGGESITSQRSD